MNSLGSGYAWVLVIAFLICLGVMYVVGYGLWYVVFSHLNSSYPNIFEPGTQGYTVYIRLNNLWRFFPIIILFAILIWAVLYTIRAERKEIYHGF